MLRSLDIRDQPAPEIEAHIMMHEDALDNQLLAVEEEFHDDATTGRRTIRRRYGNDV